MADATAQHKVSGTTDQSAGDERVGYLLVFLAAICWSLGGMIARFISEDDVWTVVFWRSAWAAVFLIGFMIWRDGVKGTLQMVRAMGLPGLAVAGCFTFCTSAFVIALAHTTVANILLMQAGAPLFAALIAFVVFGERISMSTWVAILAVIVGVAVMVSGSLAHNLSPFGDGLALTVAFVFAIATVLTRRHAHVRMTPAMCLATIMAGLIASTQASTLWVSTADMGFLFLFGAVNLGLGLAFYATGARMIPAAYAALIATFETLIGPVWVWLAHAEEPAARTLIGGAFVVSALLFHIGLEFRRLSRPAKPGSTGHAPR